MNLLELLVLGTLTQGPTTIPNVDMDDGEWRKVGKAVWSRSLRHYPGTPKFIVTVKKGVLWYAVEESCPGTTKKKQVRWWQAGAPTATLQTCTNKIEVTDLAPHWEHTVGMLPEEAQFLLRQPNAGI